MAGASEEATGSGACHGFSCANDPGDPARIAAVPEVRWVEEAGTAAVLENATTTWVLQSAVSPTPATLTPPAPLRVHRTIWDRDLFGQDQVIGHIDGPIDIGHRFFRHAVPLAPHLSGPEPPQGCRTAPARAADDVCRSHRQRPNSRTAPTRPGSAAGEEVGAGPGAFAPTANTGNAPTQPALTRLRQRYPAQRRDGLLRRVSALAHADNARIHTNSWGQPTGGVGYTDLSAAVDTFTWQHEEDLVLVSGQALGTVVAPASAKNGLVVNATRQGAFANTLRSGTLNFTIDGATQAGHDGAR